MEISINYIKILSYHLYRLEQWLVNVAQEYFDLRDFQ